MENPNLQTKRDSLILKHSWNGTEFSESKVFLKWVDIFVENKRNYK